MINKETIIYSLRNLNHRKARSLLTIFSILIGIAAIFIFISFGLGLKSFVEEFTTQTSADKVMVLSKGGFSGLDASFSLSENDLKAVQKASGVHDATGVYNSAVETSQNKNKKYTFLIAYDPSTTIVLELFGDIGIYKGRLLRQGDEGKVVLGFNYLLEDKIFPQAYDLNDRIEIDGRKLTIIGFMESVGNPQDDSQIYMTNSFYEEIYPETNGEKKYNIIMARVDTSNIEGAVENIEKALRKSRDLEEGKEDFYAQSYQDLMDSFSGALNIIIGFIIAIALVSVFVSAINTANTMITTVLERTKEVGIIKSVGAKNSDVLGIFLFESSTLGFLAGLGGVLVGWLFSSIAGNLLDGLGYGFLSPAFPIELFIGCILFAMITGGVSGIIPAINASKIKPVDALRYE